MPVVLIAFCRGLSQYIGVNAACSKYSLNLEERLFFCCYRLIICSGPPVLRYRIFGTEEASLNTLRKKQRFVVRSSRSPFHQFVASLTSCTTHHTNSGRQTKISASCVRYRMNEREVLSLNFELLHIELKIIKECDRHTNEDLFSRPMGFPSLFNEK